MSQQRLELKVKEVEIKRKARPIILRRNLTERDFKLAIEFDKKQRIKDICLENLFLSSLYSILAANENYSNQMRVYDLLCRTGLDSPAAILNDKGTAKEIIGLRKYPAQTARRIFDFCEWWEESTLPREIISDVSLGRAREFELRDQLKKEAPGVGLKTASLILNTLGYENVVPVDRWVGRYLYAKGLISINPFWREDGQTGGISNRMHRICESIIQQKAKERGVTPLNYQLAIWVAYSRFRGKIDFQIKLFPKEI